MTRLGGAGNGSGRGGCAGGGSGSGGVTPDGVVGAAGSAGDGRTIGGEVFGAAGVTVAGAGWNGGTKAGGSIAGGPLGVTGTRGIKRGGAIGTSGTARVAGSCGVTGSGRTCVGVCTDEAPGALSGADGSRLGTAILPVRETPGARRFDFAGRAAGICTAGESLIDARPSCMGRAQPPNAPTAMRPAISAAGVNLFVAVIAPSSGICAKMDQYLMAIRARFVNTSPSLSGNARGMFLRCAASMCRFDCGSYSVPRAVGWLAISCGRRARYCRYSQVVPWDACDTG